MKDTLIAGPLPATVTALTLKVYSVEGLKSDTSSEVYVSSIRERGVRIEGIRPETMVVVRMFCIETGPSICML